MADHRRHIRVVEIIRDEDGGVGIGVVVADHQLERPATDAAGGIDLLRGELRRQLHGNADGVAERAGHADSYRSPVSLAAQEQRGEEGESQAGRN